MLPLIFGAAFKFGSKVVKGLKQAKGIKNGLAAAKKISSLSSYIGTSVPIHSIASVPIANEQNSLPMQKNISNNLTIEEKIKKFAPAFVGVIVVIVLIKLIFVKR